MNTERKPLARVAAESRRQSMVMLPMRWPPALLQRLRQRAEETGEPVSLIVREAVIAGLISIEITEATRLLTGKTA